MKPFRLALFTDSAPQFLERALLSLAQAQGFAIELKVWGFTSPLAVQDELATFQPEAVCYWLCSEQARTHQLPSIEPLLALPYHWLICNLPILDEGAFGNYALLAPSSLRARLAQWNHDLLERAQTQHNLHLIDLERLVSDLGHRQCFDARLWHMAAVALTPTATELLAERILATLRVMRGEVRKVLVTDLDDTFWSGIVSDVGAQGIHPEDSSRCAYRAWLKTLAQRGILLAIASRNEIATVQEAFARDDLDFSLEDFAAVQVAWDVPKSEMLKRIAEQLGVHTSSLVFIDDRIENRNEVRAQCPDVLVPELPEDSTCWMDVLSSLTGFETLAITEDDALRAQSIKSNQQRLALAETLSQEDYLASLEQQLTPEPLSAQNVERAAQLSQRCNRFNMCNTRHTAEELLNRKGWVYRLKDRYGDMGLISVVILEQNEIVSWVMSCRAFGRGIEQRILSHLKSMIPELCGRYQPTERNTLCANLYQENGVPLP